MLSHRIIQLRLAGLLLLLVAAGIAWWLLLLSPQERWLHFFRAEAEELARQALNSSSAGEIKKTPDAFIDYTISINTKARRVIFSPHDDHSLTLAYAPDENERSFDEEGMNFVQVKSGWFEAKWP